MRPAAQLAPPSPPAKKQTFRRTDTHTHPPHTSRENIVVGVHACRRVLITSRGVVMKADVRPAAQLAVVWTPKNAAFPLDGSCASECTLKVSVRVAR